MIAGESVAAAAPMPSLQMVDVTFDRQHQYKEFLNGQELLLHDDGIDDESPPPPNQANDASPWHRKPHPTDHPPRQSEHIASYRETSAGEAGMFSRHLVRDTAHIHDRMYDNIEGRENQHLDTLAPRSEGTGTAHPILERTRSYDTGEADTQQHVSFQTPLSSIDNHMPETILPTINGDEDMLALSLPELESLNYLTEREFQGFGDSLWPSINNDGVNAILDLDHAMGESPDTYAMYYPNATYKELHATLYNHMVETAKGTGLTRSGTPDSVAMNGAPVPDDLRWHPPTQSGAFNLVNLPEGFTIQREMELWQNYLDEVALWLDMFDNDRHFQVHLSAIAQTSDTARLSILALSARQMERKDPNKPYTESLGLYQEAIRLIAIEMESMSTAVIASCVLLCVLEMMSCELSELFAIRCRSIGTLWTGRSQRDNGRLETITDSR